MIEQDTIKLLRECDAGIRMGIASIDDVLDNVHHDELRQCLKECRDKHSALHDDILALLENYHDDGKKPTPTAKGMTWIKTNMKMAVDDSDHAIADLMTDGCNMGIKSLRKYLNEYASASEKSKDLAKRLINIEEKLVTDIRGFL
jgi:hypothetical protein